MYQKLKSLYIIKLCTKVPDVKILISGTVTKPELYDCFYLVTVLRLRLKVISKRKMSQPLEGQKWSIF